MSNSDLQKWVTSDVDFYALLGISITACSDSELRRAYRKTALQYHPDKAGKDYDPEKYELFQAANGVLSDPELKAKYDAHRSAKLQRQRANELFEGKRRAMKEDLEARE
ncbi:DnaJ domain-containing protein, partial [Leptodontidium sp. 2 PMI_412]